MICCGVSASTSPANSAASRSLNSSQTSRYTAHTVAAIAAAFTANARSVPHAEQPIGQAQQVRIPVGLLVVLAARALQPAVLDAAVVADLRQPQVGQVLADALIDLLVVEDAVGARRHEQREAHRHQRPAAPSATASARSNSRQHVFEDGDAEGQAEEHAQLERPELTELQVLAERPGGRAEQPGGQDAGGRCPTRAPQQPRRGAPAADR